MCRPYKDFGLETTEEWAKFVMNNRNRTFTNVKDTCAIRTTNMTLL